MNKYNDTGSPCLRPLEAWKKPYDLPLISTENQLAVKLLRIRAIICEWNPNFSSKLDRIDQEILSKAFIMSSLMMMLAPRTFLSNEYIISLANNMLSIISRSLTKADYSLDIKEGNKGLRQLLRTLVKTLFIKVQKLIGL